MDVLARVAGEISLKSTPVQREFLRILERRIRQRLKSAGVEHSLKAYHNRFIISTPDFNPIPLLQTIFGIHSLSEVVTTCPADLSAIIAKGRELHGPVISGQHFAVRARRHGKHDFSSLDVERELGAALYACGGKVQLNDPPYVVHLEIRDAQCYFYGAPLKGAGGMPLGSGGHALSLFSGGIDSPVSTWMINKRGVTTDLLLCNFGGPLLERSVVNVALKLYQEWQCGTKPLLFVIDAAEAVAQLKEVVQPRLQQVLLKRLFYRFGEAVAKKARARALVTGEVIAQVSTQTLHNLCTIEESTALPVLRPIISFDKTEIIHRAQAMRTFEESSKVPEICQITKEKPATACALHLAKAEEEKLNADLFVKAVAGVKILSLAELSPQKVAESYLFVEACEQGATVIDCRSEDAYDAWHYPDAIHSEYFELLADYSKLAKDKTYVIYCAFGTQSAIVADKMQQDGYQAFSLVGGERAARALAVGTAACSVKW